MYRPATLPLWSIIGVICLCLGSCDFLNPVSPQTPLTLPPELSIEEHALKSMPPMDESGTFVPVESTQEEKTIRQLAELYRPSEIRVRNICIY